MTDTHFSGRYLFKVHESILLEKSEVFQDMFRAQNEVGALMIPITDGQTEAAPVVLPATISETAFELFLWHPDSKKAPNNVVFQLLELSRMFFSNDVYNEYTMMPPQLWATILKAQRCPDPDNCALDWHQLWWNGMGRSLLDGRNPQSYKDALKCFEELLLSDVGKVSPACLHSVMVTVWSGSAFHEEESFIECAAKKWADKLLK
ncbi:hypothetical protein PAXINDRAFT_156687 [Paxillus involutus ATCC 200175]|uniref:BTB domain-containing protein n=1 Tax=Paxillus involutus ATCC 200175 TaxID=664439 RepID=A0A0C9SUX1_PAXIN|nr:hypothetical protein PAXINDRAFT_156687 [Paxillus involutus ATCC 200175]